MNLITHHPVVESLLNNWREALGKDFQAYQNHVYRVINYCAAQQTLEERQLEQVAIAACFHDVGIWLDHTFDYLGPSCQRANNYLVREGKSHWIDAVCGMILEHHKVTAYQGKEADIINVFRKADWIDVSMGTLRFGVAGRDIRAVRQAFPYVGFHRMLVQLSARNLIRHPLRPLPMFHW